MQPLQAVSGMSESVPEEHSIMVGGPGCEQGEGALYADRESSGLSGACYATLHEREECLCVGLCREVSHPGGSKTASNF